MKKYLSEGSSNSKTKKNVRDTLILYMSPAKQNSIGRNLCPKASAGCLASCLYTAGRGAFSNVQKARAERTEMWIHQPDIMMYSIAKQINIRAKRVTELAVRLNGTSDTNIVDRLLNRHAIRENVVFYDYTKIRERSVFKDTQNHPSSIGRDKSCQKNLQRFSPSFNGTRDQKSLRTDGLTISRKSLTIGRKAFGL